MHQESKVEECTVVVDGARVHYWRAGSGPALVLLHGLVGSGRNWEQNMEFLGKYRTVYALDHANMGESERVKGLDAGLEASADRVAACMNALDIAKADLAGHSHGGAIAMMLAARHPGRVERLVLFAPANPFCKVGLSSIRFYKTRVGIAVAKLMPFLPSAVHRSAMRQMYGDPKRVNKKAFAGYKSQLDLRTVDHVLGIVRSWNEDMQTLREALTQLVGLPTLMIWGELDKAVGVPSGERLAELLGAQLMVLPGVGHVAFAETPEVCNQVVGEWLAAS